MKPTRFGSREARPIRATERQARAWPRRTGAAPASARCWRTSIRTAALDAAVVNGQVLPTPDGRRRRRGRFWDVIRSTQPIVRQRRDWPLPRPSPLEPAFCGIAGVWRGLAVGDVDGDGGLDLLATAWAERRVSIATSFPTGGTGSWSGRGAGPEAEGRPRRRNHGGGRRTPPASAGSIRRAATCAATTPALISAWGP